MSIRDAVRLLVIQDEALIPQYRRIWVKPATGLLSLSHNNLLAGGTQKLFRSVDFFQYGAREYVI